MTVAEVLSRISSWEITEWMAYLKMQADDERNEYERSKTMASLKGKRGRF